MGKKYFSVLYFLLMLFLSNTLYSGITGKISGKVLDAQSGESLIGVNIILLDNDIGTVTNQNGYFSIINIVPGKYSVKSSMIGYAVVTMTQVDVVMNQTITINFSLEQESIQMGEVVVEAIKPLVIHDVSSSRMDYSYE